MLVELIVEGRYLLIGHFSEHWVAEYAHMKVLRSVLRYAGALRRMWIMLERISLYMGKFSRMPTEGTMRVSAFFCADLSQQCRMRHVPSCIRWLKDASTCKGSTARNSTAYTELQAITSTLGQYEGLIMKHSLIFASLIATTAAAFAQTSTPSAPTPTEQQGTGAEKQMDKHHRGHDGRHRRPDAKKMSENQISRLDTDKDGKVSRQEFLARQSEAFSKADTNSDGYVTAEELAARHEKHHADMHAKHQARNKARSNESGTASSSSGTTTPQAK